MFEKKKSVVVVFTKLVFFLAIWILFIVRMNMVHEVSQIIIHFDAVSAWQKSVTLTMQKSHPCRKPLTLCFRNAIRVSSPSKPFLEIRNFCHVTIAFVYEAPVAFAIPKKCWDFFLSSPWCAKAWKT